MAVSPLWCGLAALLLPPASNAVIVTGVLRSGRLPLAALQLGDGGLGQPVVARGSVRAGEHVTAGGVLVRARAAGIKLDFPSGAELLVAPDGAVHVRDGSHTLPSLSGLALELADGTSVRARRAAGGRGPFASVRVVEGGKTTELWRAGLRLRRPVLTAPWHAPTLLVLGAGDVLYSPQLLGPLVCLERVLCPASARRQWPSRRLVVVGDLLVSSLRELPRHVPPRGVQFPQAPEAVRRLAAAAPVLFPSEPVWRPAGAVGELAFVLAGGFRLLIEERPHTGFWIALYRGDVEVPAVEWHLGPRTTLHLLRPDGGRHGGPRYFLRGLDLSQQVRELMPAAGSDARALQRFLRSLGARAPASRLSTHRGRGS